MLHLTFSFFFREPLSIHVDGMTVFYFFRNIRKEYEFFWLVFSRKRLKGTCDYIYQTLFLDGEGSDVTIKALG